MNKEQHIIPRHMKVSVYIDGEKPVSVNHKLFSQLVRQKVQRKISKVIISRNAIGGSRKQIQLCVNEALMELGSRVITNEDGTQELRVMGWLRELGFEFERGKNEENSDDKGNRSADK